jgi:hypothetical protein
MCPLRYELLLTSGEHYLRTKRGFISKFKSQGRKKSQVSNPLDRNLDEDRILTLQNNQELEMYEKKSQLEAQKGKATYWFKERKGLQGS